MKSTETVRPLLEIQNLRTYFYTKGGVIKAVDGVDFAIHPGEVFGIVGESGCGKSITSLSVLQLLDAGDKSEADSAVLLEGENLIGKSNKEMNRIRGKEISMIFQDPMTSLNPVLTVKTQLVETIRAHSAVSAKEARRIALEMLVKVGISSPETRMNEYPHQLSGGMKQRVMIAMALLCKPKLLIADEPTTALDVTIQAQILDLIRKMKDELGMALILITHDMGVVASMADTIMVMYAGNAVELGPAESIFKTPKHPYTQGLLKAIPWLDKTADELFSIEGAVPNPLEMPAGCKFAPRCGQATEQCAAENPALLPCEGSLVRCRLYGQGQSPVKEEVRHGG